MDRALENCSKTSATVKNPCLESAKNQLYDDRHETGDIKFIIGCEEIHAHQIITK